MPLRKLALLALDMAGYRVMKVDVSTQSGFRDAMQSLLRQAGLEKKQVAAVFSVSCTIASSMFMCCANILPPCLSTVVSIWTNPCTHTV